MTLDDILKELEQGDVLPARAADLLIFVSALYGRAADMYIKKNAEYAREFNSKRPDYKSVAATERDLDATDLGIEKHYWKYQIKKCEQVSKALNTLVYLRTAEAKNQV